MRKAKTSEAKYFLEESSLRTLEISELLCFSSVNYFTKIFREETGMTPHRYRLLVREGIQPQEAAKKTFSPDAPEEKV